MLRFLKASWLVLASSFVFGLLLAGVHASWQPRIEANERAKLQRGIRSILVDADSIATIPVTLPEGGVSEPTEIYEGFDAAGHPVGYVYPAEGTGFQDKLKLLVGVNPQLTAYRGIAVIFAAETPGFGDAIRDSAIFRGQFIGAPVAPPLTVVKVGDRKKTDDTEIVAITGATITSQSATNIINRRWQQVRGALPPAAQGGAAPRQ
jgi:electron transport complex protein RnfG